MARCSTPRQHRVRQPERRAQRARRARTRGAVLRSDRLLAAGGRPAGQPDPQQRSGRAGFWNIDASLFKRFAINGSRFAEFRIDAYNVTNSVRWGNPPPATAPRPATRSARSPAPPAVSAACASAAGSCSNRGSGPGAGKAGGLRGNRANRRLVASEYHRLPSPEPRVPSPDRVTTRAVILARGLGTRMRSTDPGGRPHR